MINKNITHEFLNVLILFLMLGNLPAKADYITTEDFIINVNTTMEVITSGYLNSNIQGLTGIMDTALGINFNITTNEIVNNIYLRATITDMDSNTHSAFCCTNTSQTTSQPIYLIFSERNSSNVTAASIEDCKNTSSTAINNPCTIAYSGTVSIDNGGNIQYVQNGGEGYFNANIPTGTTNLNMTLTTSPKTGTYDIYSSADYADNYEVTIYLDNIP